MIGSAHWAELIAPLQWAFDGINRSAIDFPRSDFDCLFFLRRPVGVLGLFGSCCTPAVQI